MVYDETGRPWEVRELIGTGGQGAVYRVQDPRFAVKLLHAKDRERDQVEQALYERLSVLRLLPLDDLPVARPRVTLQPPDVGYVMDFLTDVVPIRDLVYPPPDTAENDIRPWYRQTGGLRRRLRVLARCAEIFAELHGRGIVYCDVSPANIMISATAQREEVWLIDADNLTFETDALSASIVTPYFAAPELLREGGGNTPFTDAFSFAVLTYHALVGDHPLIGDLVAEGAPELERDAQLGLIPWVEHSSDSQNRSSTGMVRTEVLHPKLRALCERTFEGGMFDPLARPDLASWAAALRAAADRILDCPSCRIAYYASASYCPSCGTRRPPVVLISVLVHVPASELPPSGRDTLVPTKELIVVQANEPCRVTARSTDLLADEPRTPVVEVRWDGATRLTIHNLSRDDLRFTAPSGGASRVIRSGLAASTPVDA
ncbi:MAG: hypothetical protein LC808_30100, partial [Actinobacteria bacterium]|nr:hypothetical protein [Actinomycetota bacterium]